uniref:Uncharacterized protein n=1 Tax=Candidatus Methanogaster sp. ANME-2c ERB4 TaxID=2759911 RepID=A0A7G9YIP4_9EURY|nr:hypothetical protein OALCLDJD_00001 [Methanosarcinales archaeon ANME-2c ERB4]
MRTRYHDKTALPNSIRHIGFHVSKIYLAVLKRHLRVAGLHIDQLVDGRRSEIIFVECLVPVGSVLLIEISVLERTASYERACPHKVHRVCDILPDVFRQNRHRAADILHERRVRAAHVYLNRVRTYYFCPVHTLKNRPAVGMLLHVRYGESDITGSHRLTVVPCCILCKIKDVSIFFGRVFPVFRKQGNRTCGLVFPYKRIKDEMHPHVSGSPCISKIRRRIPPITCFICDPDLSLRSSTGCGREQTDTDNNHYH